MQEDGQTPSPFWNAGQEDNPDVEHEHAADRHGSSSPELSFEKFRVKQTALDDEWEHKSPDDMIMMRDDIGGAKYVYIGCTALYLLMTLSDGDASPISPLREQLWPLGVIALLAPLHYLVSRQHREVRWHAEEMTVVIYRKGIFGASSCFVASATKLQRGDELVINSQTHTWTSSEGESKSSTNYWIELHRNGQQCDTFGDDWNNQGHLMATVDFLQQKIS